jgi:hypothetical protein
MNDPPWMPEPEPEPEIDFSRFRYSNTLAAITDVPRGEYGDAAAKATAVVDTGERVRRGMIGRSIGRPLPGPGPEGIRLADLTSRKDWGR